MKASVVAVLALTVALALPAPGQAASFKSCGTFQAAGTGKARYQAKGMSCRAAKRVLRGAGMTLCFDNAIPGWRKEWRALPSGGRALTLKKGDKAIKTNACSPH